MKSGLDFKNINYHKKLKKIVPEGKHKKVNAVSRIIAIAIPVIMTITVGAVYFYFDMKRDSLKDEVNHMNRYLKSEDYLNAMQEIDDANTLRSIINTYVYSINAAHTSIQSLPEIDNIMVNAIYSVDSEATISNITLSDGVITFDVMTSNYVEAPLYVQELRETGLFYDVGYAGFKTLVDTAVSFSVSCYVY